MHPPGPCLWRYDKILLAAAELTIKVERVGLKIAPESSVAAVGEMEVSLGALKSAPRKVEKGIGVRNVDQAWMNSMF